jgi:hypothetical protein
MWLLNEWQRPLGSSMPLICWRCDASMKIKVITRAMSSAPLGEIVYVCPACNLERKQTVPRGD